MILLLMSIIPQLWIWISKIQNVIQNTECNTEYRIQKLYQNTEKIQFFFIIMNIYNNKAKKGYRIQKVYFEIQFENTNHRDSALK